MNIVVYPGIDGEVSPAAVKSCVKRIVKDWECIADEDIDVERIYDGITNLIYKVSCHSKSHRPPLIFRVFGSGSSLLVDRKVENVIFTALSDRDVGPGLVGTFRNGRIEEFCNGTPLQRDAVSGDGIVDMVAEALAEFHSQTITGIDRSAPSLWPKLWQLLSIARSGLSVGDSFRDLLTEVDREAHWLAEYLQGPPTTLRLYRDGDAAFSSGSTDGHTVNTDGHTNSSVIGVSTESHHHRLGVALASELVLCHNDLLAGNILVTNNTEPETETETKTEAKTEAKTATQTETKTETETTTKTEAETETEIGKKTKTETQTEVEVEGCDCGISGSRRRPITLIDFEYAGYNYRAYDFANYFNEYAGFECNYSRDFPTQTHRRHMIKAYLCSLSRYAAAGARVGVEGKEEEEEEEEKEQEEDGHQSGELLRELREVVAQHHDEESDRSDRDDAAFDEVVEAFDSVVCKFTLASHLFWGTWAVVQSHVSSIDFDFETYARLRYDGYYFHKEQFCSKENSVP